VLVGAVVVAVCTGLFLHRKAPKAIAAVDDKASQDDVDEIKEVLRDLTTRCEDREFEKTAHTATSDRECVEFSKCKDTEFIETAGNKKKDVVCADFSTCKKDKEFESKGPVKGLTDRVCTTLTECDPDEGEFVSVKPTATTDRECITAFKNCKAILDDDKDVRCLHFDRILHSRMMLGFIMLGLVRGLLGSIHDSRVFIEFTETRMRSGAGVDVRVF
jgi:hypothetical protein